MDFYEFYSQRHLAEEPIEHDWGNGCWAVQIPYSLIKGVRGTEIKYAIASYQRFIILLDDEHAIDVTVKTVPGDWETFEPTVMAILQTIEVPEQND